MLKMILFANALRLRKGINYPLVKEGLGLKSIILPAWVELVNKYTQLDLTEYSILDMLHRFTSGNLVIEVPKQSEIKVRYNKAAVASVPFVSFRSRARTNRWLLPPKQLEQSLKGLLKDDVVYDKATQWFTFFNGRITSKRTLLHSGDKALLLSVVPPVTYNEIAIFRKFVAKKLNLTREELKDPRTRRKFSKAVALLIKDPVKKETLKALSLKVNAPVNYANRNELLLFEKFVAENLKVKDYYMILPKPQEKGIFMVKCDGHKITNEDPLKEKFGWGDTEGLDNYIKYHWSLEDVLKITVKDLYGE